MKTVIEIPTGATQKETWEKDPYFCPCCGEQPVWSEDHAMLDNEGTFYFCTTCKAEFYLRSVSPLCTASASGAYVRSKRAELLLSQISK